MVADALLPHMIQVLPRNRWVNSLTAFMDYAILTVHNILQRAGLRWLDKLSGKKKLEPVPRPEPGAVGGSRATLAVEAGSEGWVLSDSEQEGDRQEQPEELEEELREDGEEKQTTPNETFRGSERDWNIFNSEQRGKAKTFLEKGAFGRYHRGAHRVADLCMLLAPCGACQLPEVGPGARASLHYHRPCFLPHAGSCQWTPQNQHHGACSRVA